MFKTYRKFSIRFLGVDPDQKPESDIFVPDLEIKQNEPDIQSIDGATEEIKDEITIINRIK